jgi:MYXO-CTERM domain-containing protein
MKLRHGLLAVACSTGAGCATDLALDVETSAVIGGQVTPAGKFPGVGALMYDFGGGPPQFGCTGTLIAPDAVLTAGHCLDGVPSAPGFTLALDTNAGAPVVVPGRMAIKHEMFNINAEIGEGLGEFFDVGILLLAQPITEVAPVPMPRPADAASIVADLDLEIVGYGENGVANAGVLYDATTKLISLNPSEIQVGSGSPQPQNCYGDSGGPGFANVGGIRRVIGVVSRSFMGGECNMGGVDTRVDAYLTWIHSKVNNVPCDSGMSPECKPPDPVDPDPVDPDPTDPDDDGDSGGCSTTGGTSGGLLALVGALLLRRRRR